MKLWNTFQIHVKLGPQSWVEESGPATATATSYSYRLQILVECWNPIQTARVCIRPQHHGKGCSSQGFLHLHNHSPPLAFQEGKGHSQCSVESRQPRPPAPFPTWLPTRNLRKLRLSGQTNIIYIFSGVCNQTLHHPTPPSSPHLTTFTSPSPSFHTKSSMGDFTAGIACLRCKESSAGRGVPLALTSARDRVLLLWRLAVASSPSPTTQTQHSSHQPLQLSFIYCIIL